VADAYMMKHIVHDWSDDHCVTIFKHCRKNMLQNGRLLVLELVVPSDPTMHFSKILDLEMLVMTHGGRERTEREFAALFDRAGFKLARIVPTPQGTCVIEGRPV
jgi:hypothetical protein